MGLYAQQLLDLVVKPTIKLLPHYSESCLKLIMGTIACETEMGYYLKQTNGPALGLGQIEPETYMFLVDYILRDYETYREFVSHNPRIMKASPLDLCGDLFLNVGMIRVKYLTVPEPMPTHLEAMADYYKLHYNTLEGKAKRSDFIDKFEKYCLNLDWSSEDDS